MEDIYTCSCIVSAHIGWSLILFCLQQLALMNHNLNQLSHSCYDKQPLFEFDHDVLTVHDLIQKVVFVCICVVTVKKWPPDTENSTSVAITPPSAGIISSRAISMNALSWIFNIN